MSAIWQPGEGGQGRTRFAGPTPHLHCPPASLLAAVGSQPEGACVAAQPSRKEECPRWEESDLGTSVCRPGPSQEGVGVQLVAGDHMEDQPRRAR